MRIKKMELPDGWYPKDETICKQDIDKFLLQYSGQHLDDEWIAGIVPHAGWFYSGQLACQVIHLLSQTKRPDVVVLFGGHLRASDQITYYDYELFETPFGNIDCHQPLLEKVVLEIAESAVPEEFADNTVEIQLPFIKYFFPDSKIIAFRSPPSGLSLTLTNALVSKLAELNLSATFIGSTDLTHYGISYGFTPKGAGREALDWVKNDNDQEFITHLRRMEGDLAIEHSLANHSACSAGAAASCLMASQAFGRTAGHIVDYYTSYDVVQNSSFVGYVGMLY